MEQIPSKRLKTAVFWMVTDGGGKADGARGRIRTADTAIFSRMLYQLSYPGPFAMPEMIQQRWEAGS